MDMYRGKILFLLKIHSKRDLNFVIVRRTFKVKKIYIFGGDSCEASLYLGQVISDACRREERSGLRIRL